ncbi:GNAT family N-acetyltransferase [Spirochaeta isovalerica]|uniref:Mycothiol synthase n=1 Tax=Spirochaeta isovalerica TaxID=150 RepID=A0A841RD57_9SPIO|nr:GNAT family N-acetyltransferase [Spirochaeta isovalerica]MBB6480322.1 mycothiol synthase [Spirochaeta isovalerica]
MTVTELNDKNLTSFLAYCRDHKYDHDESFLYDEDLKDFAIGPENPTWLLFDGDDLRGVLSLICDEYFVKGKRARIRIFHCEKTDIENYRSLLEAALPLDCPVDKMEMFLPDKLKETQSLIRDLGFTYYRTSFVMVRKNKEKTAARFPEGFSLKAIDPQRDAELYGEIRNAAFRNLKGSETPLSREDVLKHYNDKSVLTGGMAILRDGDKGAGIVRVIKEEDETGIYSFIAPIALIPEYQGRGLGKELLKAGISIGQENGLDDCMLVVNGENEQALRLYKGAGFEIDMSVSCFTFSSLL